MAEPVTFGRRTPAARTPSASPQAAAPTRSAPTPDPGPRALSADLWRGSGPSGFAAWNEDRRRKLMAMWALRIGLLVPGLLGFALHLSVVYAVGLEAAGLVANGLLKRERKRYRSEVAAWDEDAPGA